MIVINGKKYRLVANGEKYKIARIRSVKPIVIQRFLSSTTWVVPETGEYEVFLKSGGSFRDGESSTTYYAGVRKTGRLYLEKGQSVAVAIGRPVNLRIAHDIQYSRTAIGTIEVQGVSNQQMTYSAWNEDLQGKGYVSAILRGGE